MIGTGASGMLRVPEGVARELEAMGIKVVQAPTKRAVEIYNSLPEERKAAALHLTC